MQLLMEHEGCHSFRMFGCKSLVLSCRTSSRCTVCTVCTVCSARSLAAATIVQPSKKWLVLSSWWIDVRRLVDLESSGVVFDASPCPDPSLSSAGTSADGVNCVWIDNLKRVAKPARPVPYVSGRNNFRPVLSHSHFWSRLVQLPISINARPKVAPF